MASVTNFVFDHLVNKAIPVGPPVTASGQKRTMDGEKHNSGGESDDDEAAEDFRQPRQIIQAPQLDQAEVEQHVRQLESLVDEYNDPHWAECPSYLLKAVLVTSKLLDRPVDRIDKSNQVRQDYVWCLNMDRDLITLSMCLLNQRQSLRLIDSPENFDNCNS